MSNKLTREQNREIAMERFAFANNEKMLAKMAGMPEPTAFDLAKPAAVANSDTKRTLPRDAYIDTDSLVTRLLKTSANVVDALMPGTVRNVNIGKRTYEYTATNKLGAVKKSTTFRNNDAGDSRLEIIERRAPIAVFQVPFEIPYEDMVLDSAEYAGVIVAESAAQAMDEAWREVENVTINGDTIDGQVIEGLRSTGAGRLRAATDNNLRAATGGESLANVWQKNLITISNLLAAEGHDVTGGDGFDLYVNDQDWLAASMTQIRDGYPMKVGEEVVKIPGINRIVTSRTIPANEMLAIIPRPEWFVFAQGLPMRLRGIPRTNPLAPFQWEITGKLAPVVKRDFAGHTGIAQLTG